MTEQEAKTKVCPVGAMRGSYDGNWDRGHCIGSACMAWRWDREELESGTPGYTRKSETDGYCGLAGKP